MALTKAFVLLAERLQEAAIKLCSQDVHQRLESALSSAIPQNEYAYVSHVFGDDKKGDVVYRHGGKYKRASYKMGKTDGNHTASIDHESAIEVMPRTDFYIPGASGEEDTDIGEAKPATDIEVTGDFVAIKEGAVGQDGTAYLKLIAPGWGSSGYYSREMLARDGARVFPKGTKNFWNHQTATQEAERPEGDLNDFASVLTEDAKWMDNGPTGPGLYARAKVHEKYRQSVDDLAKHIGVSIRATGKAKEGKAEGRTGPIIEELTRGISADYVTAAGAGGQVLQLFEAARRGPVAVPITEGADMDQAAFTKLQESNNALQAQLRKTNERLALAEAGREIGKIFAPIAASDAIKKRVTERLLTGDIKLTESGELDLAVLKTVAEAELKGEVAYIQSIAGTNLVAGMGQQQQRELTESERKELADVRAAEATDFAQTLGWDSKERAPLAHKILEGGRQYFDPHYNSALKGNGRVIVGTEAT